MKKIVAAILCLIIMCGCSENNQIQRHVLKQKTYEGPYPFENTKLSFAERTEDLVSRMTLEEKVCQMDYKAQAIERLGVPEYNWSGEALHGVAKAGVATVFPQSIGIASTFDTDLMLDISTAISDEARGKHHAYAQKGYRGFFTGLDFWSPNINIFRDPRWGRGQETFGECPYLTSRMAVQFVKGMQGEHSKYLKTVSTPKHFAVHSGPDGLRHKFNAVASKKDMYETYLPAFRASVIEGGAKSIMCAYNRTNDVVCCGHNYLQQELLRDKWGFNGYIVSDCAAVLYFHKFHKVTASHAESVALAVKNGCDLNCGSTYNPYLLEAVKKGYITEPQIDVSVKRLMKARMQLGLFDPPEMVPYANIPYEVVDCPKHKQIALNAARESIILLKNDGLLPLNLSENLDIAVIGPNADAAEVQWGNYNGTPSQTITPLQGIRNKTAGRCDVTWALGTLHINNPDDRHDRIQRRLTEAVLTAERSDIVILCLGISSDIEGEAGSTKYPELAGDRADIKLPPGQVDLFKAVKATGKPIITVLMSGSVLQVAEIYDDCNAVIQQFYPGQAGGTAIADIIFGDVNPAGRLPVTCYKSTKDIPEITNYDMAGRTYRYFQGTPLFPFGFGLSYTSFRYSNLDTEAVYTDYSKPLELSVDVENTGSRAGDEVVQVYISHPDKPDAPLKQLVAFKRTNLERGSKKTVKLIIDPRCLAVVNQQGRHILSPGKVKIFVSGKLPCKRSDELCDTNVLSTEIMIEGPAKKLDI